ncbi:MAG: glycosyltransferase family 39 protein [Candidatus Krumholzibacteria bacterium]|nr:glycosyltransferase family 39 protein [Candidatus Krumholzibacteria bacterium]
MAPQPLDMRRNLTYALAVFVVALVIRAVYFHINRTQNPLFYDPILDSRFHHEWASEILAGNFWGDDVFFRAPLYPYFLALLHKISGSSIAFAVFVQHVLGSLSCVFVYFLCRQFFAWSVSLAAGLLAALYWPFIYFEGDLLIVSLVVFLDTLLLLSLVLAVRQDKWVMFFVSGLILGLSAIARPSILIFLPVIPVAFLLSPHWTSHEHTGPSRAWRRRTIWVFAGLVVVVSPVVIRNYIVGRDLVPIASQGGVNFYIGNNPHANGSQARVPGLRPDLHGTFRGAIELAEKDLGRELKPSQASNYFFKKGLEFIADSPGQAARLTLKKLYLFWAGVERSNNKYIQFFWRNFGLGRVPLPGFWLVGPLGLLGGVLLWSRRRELALLYLFTVSYMIGVVVFFVNARFRLPVVPVLIVFSAYSLCYLYALARYKRAGLFRVMGVLAVCTVIVDYDFVAFRGVRSFDEAASHYVLGNAYLKADKKDAALESFEKAHDMQQKYPTRGYLQIAGEVDYQLGALYKEKAYTSRAVAALERVRADHPLGVPAARILGELYEQTGEFNRAMATYSSVLDAVPNDSASLLGLARLYKQVGDAERSNEYLRRLSDYYPNDLRVQAQIRELQSSP